MTDTPSPIPIDKLQAVFARAEEVVSAEGLLLLYHDNASAHILARRLKRLKEAVMAARSECIKAPDPVRVKNGLCRCSVGDPCHIGKTGNLALCTVGELRRAGVPIIIERDSSACVPEQLFENAVNEMTGKITADIRKIMQEMIRDGAIDVKIDRGRR